MAITVKPFSENALSHASDLSRILKDVLSDLEDQLNQRAQIYTSTDGRIPAGLNRNDVLLIAYKGRMSILVKAARGFNTLTADHIGGLLANGTNFLGLKTDSVLASTAHFPRANDWGFYERTGGSPGFFLCFNHNGVIKKVALT